MGKIKEYKVDSAYIDMLSEKNIMSLNQNVDKQKIKKKILKTKTNKKKY